MRASPLAANPQIFCHHRKEKEAEARKQLCLKTAHKISRLQEPLK
jgi:hypothetical protein